MSLAPDGGADRHHLADYGFCRELSAEDHRRDIVDSDTTGHPPTPHVVSIKRLSLVHSPCRVSDTHRNGLPNLAGVKRDQTVVRTDNTG